MKTRKTDQHSKGDLNSTADLNGGATTAESGTAWKRWKTFDHFPECAKLVSEFRCAVAYREGAGKYRNRATYPINVRIILPARDWA